MCAKEIDMIKVESCSHCGQQFEIDNMVDWKEYRDHIKGCLGGSEKKIMDQLRAQLELHQVSPQCEPPCPKENDPKCASCTIKTRM